MQLDRRRGATLLALTLALVSPPIAHAQSRAEATSTIFYEAGGPLHMTVVNPAVEASVAAGERLSIEAGWEADVVTGASVAVVDAPGAVDAVTSATKLDDVRHVLRAGASLRDDTTRLGAQYAYGFERDYRSHGLTVSASSELFERNTTLEISYGRGWDAACDLRQPQADEAVTRQRLPDAEGCFSERRTRSRRDVDLHALQGSWTQAWTPVLSTQWSVSAQLVSGFQSNPYRAVWLGRVAAQEHHPRERARYATTVSARLWLRPVGGALQLSARLYRDTWDVRAVSGELAYERGLGAWLRVRARARHHRQSGAAFYSDDYALAPRGAYFTGDRELSPMQSWLLGARLELAPDVAGAERALTLLDALRLVVKGDFLVHDFADFHYGTAAVPNRRSILATVSVEATF